MNVIGESVVETLDDSDMFAVLDEFGFVVGVELALHQIPSAGDAILASHVSHASSLPAESSG